MTTKLQSTIIREEIQIQTPKTVIKGDLCMPQNPSDIVLFAHGAGSSRLSPRNKYIL